MLLLGDSRVSLIQTETDILIVGAGPTGLVLALWLARSGIKPRIIDKAAGPGEASRAMAVQARTLEYYRQLGIADDVIARGLKMLGIRVRHDGHVAARFEFGDLGAGISPYPFVLSFPQDEHEKLLLAKLNSLGVTVEWNTELTGLHDDGLRVSAKIRVNDSESEIECSYLCGCDGAHSAVRQRLGIGFTGGTYPHRFFVADVSATGPAADGNINGCFGVNNLCLVFPIRTTGSSRLIGILPESLANREQVTYDDVRDWVQPLIGLQVTQVNWFSTYRIHHRVADRFQVGRVFIAGDAGHVHSPVGGQGMNTGIGDAVNLAWKLAAVIRNRGPSLLLNTYQSERIRYARSLVATTDRAFSIVIGHDLRGWAFRRFFVPFVMPLALRFAAFRRFLFRLVSQTQIEYTPSPLSVGRAGQLRAGHRLPWISSLNNFRPLQSLDWQIHVYGHATPTLKEAGQQHNIPLHEFAWSHDAYAAGLHRNAVYLVRPDGYVGYVSAGQDVSGVVQYVREFGSDRLGSDGGAMNHNLSSSRKRSNS